MELRKDYILERWAIIAERRAKRPDEFKQEKESSPPGQCFFCPGSERETPPEISRVEKDGKWIIRNFPNKFSFLEPQGSGIIKTANSYFTYSDAYGEHEVIVETPDHNKQLWDLSPAEIKEIFKVYASRITELSKRHEYVVIFKNSGRDAGTSIFHSHSQLAALDIVPPNIREEAEKGVKDQRCLYCEILDIERTSFRRVYETKDFVSFCPYASRFNFEAWLFPKFHTRSITEMSDSQLLEMAEMLHKLLRKLSELDADYNMALHYAPKGKDLHFHIELMPRLAKWAGFELSSGIIVNAVSPENAAKFYRGEQ
jgi:UDPglucose--hexose-1-phosphate uridylyltransferase